MAAQDIDEMKMTTSSPTEDGGMNIEFNSVSSQLSAQAQKIALQMPNYSEMINLVEYIEENDKQQYPSYYNEKDLKIGKNILQELGDIVVTEFKYDNDSRKEWMDNAINDLKLFKAYMGTKTYPFENCSNVHLPMMTTAVLQFQARAYDALIPSKNVVQILNTENPKFITQEKIGRSDRVEKHMNYQLLYEMEEFEEDMDKLLIELPVTGTSFKKTYFDPIKNRNVSSFISGLDICINYGAKSIESAQRISHIIYLYPNEIRQRVASGIFDEEAWNLGHGTFQFEHQKYTDELDKTSGVKQNNYTTTKPRVFIEQHRYWDFNNDGIAEPYVITVDYETRKVVRITDRRFMDAFGKPIILDYITKYGFIPNPNGFYDIGFGTLMRGLNESAISIVNEVIDAGALANLQGGFVAKRSGIKKGNLTFSMGEWKEVDTYIDDISKAIYTFNFKGPNQTLYATLGLLYEYSKLVASVSETMTGQLPASDTPASTVLALIEEGRKVFSSIHKRIHRSFKKELKKLFRLNSIFLDSEKYFAVIGENNIPQQLQEVIARTDYLETYDVIPVSDPIITSRAEKVMKAEKVLQTIMSSPISSQNPMNIYNATVRFLSAFDTPAIEEIFSMPQQPASPPDMPAAEENMSFINNKPSTALPQQVHQEHLTIHDELINGAFKDSVPVEGKRMLQDHIQQHIGYMYMHTKIPSPAQTNQRIQ